MNSMMISLTLTLPQRNGDAIKARPQLLAHGNVPRLTPRSLPTRRSLSQREENVPSYHQRPNANPLWLFPSVIPHNHLVFKLAWPTSLRTLGYDLCMHSTLVVDQMPYHVERKNMQEC